MIKVKDISDFINKIAPYSTQCSWDNCGLLIGDPDKTVKKIAFALDLTSETLSAAREFEADLLLTHHPVIFKPQSRLIKGSLIYDAVTCGISVISAHTCDDCADGGVNDVLCEIIGINNVEGVPSDDCKVPMAEFGDIAPVSSDEFASYIAERLNTVCKGTLSDGTISRVAVCGGSGMDFFDAAVSMGADAFVTGEAGHHHFIDAAEKGITLIVAGHFETEAPSMLRLMDAVSNEFNDVDCVVINQTNPVKFFG